MADLSGLPSLPAGGVLDGVDRDPFGGPAGRESMWDVSDEALFAGYASGDPEAAAVFVRRVERKVYGLALSIVRDPAERRGSVVAWLLGITRNVALDSVRGRGRRAEPAGDVPTELPVDPTDVGELVGRRADAARVIVLMQQLPEAQREALVAVTLLGLSTREVSEWAAVPHGTVKTRVRLALRKLRDEMGDRVQWP